jgi:hypothetical protein
MVEAKQLKSVEKAKVKARVIEMRARAIMVKATAVKKMTSATNRSNMLGAVTLYNSLGFKDKAAASLQMYTRTALLQMTIDEQ